MDIMIARTVLRDKSSASEEVELIKASLMGDNEAFNQLVLSYQSRIYNLAFRILGDMDSANDVAQNTFLTAYLNLPRFRNGSFRSWLFRIATNLCYDEFRRHKRHPVYSIDNEDFPEEIFYPLGNISGTSPLPEVELDRLEMEQAIQKALNQLEADQRMVVVLVDQMEFDYKETARILGIPVGTVKSRLARARFCLRNLLMKMSIVYN